MTGRRPRLAMDEDASRDCASSLPLTPSSCLRASLSKFSPDHLHLLGGPPTQQ